MGEWSLNVSTAVVKWALYLYEQLRYQLLCLCFQKRIASRMEDCQEVHLSIAYIVMPPSYFVLRLSTARPRAYDLQTKLNTSLAERRASTCPASFS